MRYFFILGRNPRLSTAEIFSYLEKNKVNIRSYLIKENAMLLDLDKNIDTKNSIEELGGVVALGKVLFSGNLQDVMRSINEKEIYFDKEIKFLYSILNFSDEDSFLKIKEVIKNKFKEEELKAVYRPIEPIPTRIKSVDKAFFLFKDKDYFFGVLEGTYNPKEIEKRDMEKPSRREELAISPRLAKILINLSQVKKKETLLDPFCGIGVILQEALLQGINVIGVDIDKNAVEDAGKNISWIKKKYNVNSEYKLINGDSRKIKIRTVDGVATEPSLGILLTKNPSKEQAILMIKKFENLVTDVFNNIKKFVKEDGKIAFTSPLIRTNERRVSCDINKICERTGLKLYNTHIKFPIREFRENQIIGREIYVLVKV